MLPTKPSYHKNKIKLCKFVNICNIKDAMNKTEKRRDRE